MTASGRPFHTWAAATGKARLPTVDSLMGGMTRRLVLADRRARRPGRSATVTRGPRYRGALSCRTLYTLGYYYYYYYYYCGYQEKVSNAEVSSLLSTSRRSPNRRNTIVPDVSRGPYSYRQSGASGDPHALPRPPAVAPSIDTGRMRARCRRWTLAERVRTGRVELAAMDAFRTGPY